MKKTTTRLLIGVFLTAALTVSATYTFANAPNIAGTMANPVDQYTTLTTWNAGSQNSINTHSTAIVDTALITANVTGGTLVYGIAPVAVSAGNVRISNAQAVANMENNDNDVALTAFKNGVHDAIFHIAPAVPVANVPQLLGTEAIQNVTTTAVAVTTANQDNVAKNAMTKAKTAQHSPIEVLNDVVLPNVATLRNLSSYST